ncbi:Uncharacterised protein [Bordetella pertussis]|nr:Uncharacterised protein [Bordetella pertussis]
MGIVDLVEEARGTVQYRPHGLLMPRAAARPATQAGAAPGRPCVS